MSKYSNNMPADLQAAIGWLYDYIKPGSKFLDFGCATGYFGSIIKKDKKCTVDGVEISSDIVEARKVLDTVYSFDIDGEWPEELLKKKYDYIFFGDVIEHLKDPTEALKKTMKILNKNGMVFVSTPNVAHISTRLELLQGNFEYESMGILDSTHLKYFTYRSLTQIVHDAGFSIHAMDYTMNDYPQDVIEKILRKVGLSPNKKFWEMVDSKEARTYQFKFVLVKKSHATKKKDKTIIQPLPEKPEQFREGIIKSYENELSALKDHADEQAKIIQHLSNQEKALREENIQLKHKIYSSISHKTKRAARKILRRR